MATATYADFMLRHPGATAPQATVEALLDDVAAEISARCIDYGTDYETLVEQRGDLVRSIECGAAYRICPRGAVDGVEQTGLSSFSQTVGDHRWEYSYSGGNGNSRLLRSEWSSLGLAGAKMGWLVPNWSVCDD